MTTGAVVFMAISWTFVLGLTSWALSRVMSAQAKRDPDGPGPEKAPTPPAARIGRPEM
jgi:hypothetical protein